MTHSLAHMDSFIHQLQSKQDLTPLEIPCVADALLNPDVDESWKESLLEALSSKGETPAEIAGFVEAFLAHSVNPAIDSLNLSGPTIDVCGTGGDQLNLFNVSTTSMFIVAAAGAVVVKHGNRGITSKSGGADVLEALDIRIDLPPDHFRHCLSEAGLGFMFAPFYHPAFKEVANVRKKLASKGQRTIFNLIGPLLNPARPDFQLVGVSQPTLAPVFIEILKHLKRKSAWVVNGTTLDGRFVDELSLSGPSTIHRMGHSTCMMSINPESLGLATTDVQYLVGGDAADNAQILKQILAGKETGPKRDIVLLNAAAAITCTNLSSNLEQGLEIARNCIASGAAYHALERLQKASQAAF